REPHLKKKTGAFEKQSTHWDASQGYSRAHLRLDTWFPSSRTTTLSFSRRTKKGLFGDKSRAAIAKNFRQVKKVSQARSKWNCVNAWN
ncbi:hypothetical protein HPB47_010566, partial [Ixodes persulcatus]